MPNDLRKVFAPPQDAEIDRRIALHEFGRAIACAVLGIGPVRSITSTCSPSSGRWRDAARPDHAAKRDDR